jgi:hypothetical protein
MATGHTTFREIAEGIRTLSRPRRQTRDADDGHHRPIRTPRKAERRRAVHAGVRTSRSRGVAAAGGELGYDDVCLHRFGHTEATPTEADLREIRCLLPN